eukprot:gene20209-24017_t
MDILKLSTEWAKAEVFSAKITLLLSLLFFLSANGFWLLGKTAMAKAFVWPMVIAGILIAAISAGLYLANKPRIVQFEKAYNSDAKTFVQTEIARTTKSLNELALVFKILPLMIMAAGLLIIFVDTPLWRAIGITTIALMTVLMFVDSNTDARNTAYQDSFVYSCSFEQQRGYEQFVPHHVLSFQFSGETHIQHQNGKLTLNSNQILLSKKNQLAKAIKIPANNQGYKSISVLLTDTILQQYALENSIHENKIYQGDKNIVIQSDTLLESYFQSLLPYAEQSEKINKKLAAIKTNEAIALLLRLTPSLRSFLFDFSAPYKIDLEKFMLENYHYNVPVVHFAKLTGRSLAAFKRDFGQIFQSPPRKWLQEKRLAEAYHLIRQKKGKPAEVYLEVGFENLSHFYFAFKQKFGVTSTKL